MDGKEPGPLPEFIGVAGRCQDDQERSYVRQAMFLLRFRIKCLDRVGAAPLATSAADPAVKPQD